MSSGSEPTSNMSASARAADGDISYSSSLPDLKARQLTLAAGAANAQCDAEPIHIPGGIQPHGYLLCLSDTLTILQASENLAVPAGRPVEQLLGQPVDVLLGVAAAAQIARAVESTELDAAPLYIGVVENVLYRSETARERPIASVDGPEFDITIHRHDGNLIVELEVARHSSADVFASMYPLVRTFTRSLQDVHHFAWRARHPRWARYNQPDEHRSVVGRPAPTRGSHQVGEKEAAEEGETLQAVKGPISSPDEFEGNRGRERQNQQSDRRSQL